MNIEFRGINEESGRFVYGCLIQSKPNKVDGDCASWIKPRDALMLGALSTPTDTFTKVKTSTVGQFTGLTDKNGVEIFEGDVLLVGYNYIGKVIVKFENGKYNASSYNLKKCKLIGNIHQHSHLLDKGE